jgi:hypothetical protein
MKDRHQLGHIQTAYRGKINGLGILQKKHGRVRACLGGDKKCQKKPFESLLWICHENSPHCLLWDLLSKFCIAPDIYAQCVYLVVVVEPVFRAMRRRKRQWAFGLYLSYNSGGFQKSSR